MHELAVTESILSIAEKHARQAQAARVTDIYLVIGQLSSIVDESVQFYWDMIAEKTICEGAQLHFKRVPARMVCLDCQTEYDFGTQPSPCPQCSSSRVKISAGEEFFLDSIAIEKESV